MSSGYSIMAVLVVLSVLHQASVAQPLMHREIENLPQAATYDDINQQLDAPVKHLTDEESAEAMLMNYLYAKQLFQRMRNNNNRDAAGDMQRKRSYWKQCAFNAVSCFGRKRK